MALPASRFLAVLLLGFAIPGWVDAQDGAADKVIASVGGRTIALGDLDEAWLRHDASGRTHLLQQLYDARRRALDIAIGEYLIEREAEAQDISKLELLARELPRRTRRVTDDDVKMFYDRNRQAFGERVFEEMRSELRTRLQEQARTQAMYLYMGELRMAATDVRIMLDAPRIKIGTLSDDPVRGSTTARIEIVEFGDFQCPYCLQLFAILKELLREYGDSVRLVYKDFPLPGHREAFKAAEAANCAQEQGRFWEYHDTLFANQSALGLDALKRYAGDLGLDAAAFATCLDRGRFAKSVQRDLEIGESYGVSSTPTIFINGRPVVGLVPVAVLRQIVEEELALPQRR